MRALVAEKEIKELYKQFRKETPTGTLTRKEFRDVMKQMEFSDASVQDLIFGVFDIDRDGVISFKEFILSLSSMTRGTPDEKLECMYLPSLLLFFLFFASIANFACLCGTYLLRFERLV
jgi:Ca2+-binding EF-hand superfamily protein